MALATIALIVFLALYCVDSFVHNEVLRVLCAIAAGVTAVLLLIGR